MVRHIVIWKFKASAEGASREVNLQKCKLLLESLKGLIPEISELEVGIDISHTDFSYDLVLNSEFPDRDALITYLRHPDHIRVVEFLRKVHEGRVVVDYVC